MSYQTSCLHCAFYSCEAQPLCEMQETSPSGIVRSTFYQTQIRPDIYFILNIEEELCSVSWFFGKLCVPLHETCKIGLGKC